MPAGVLDGSLPGNPDGIDSAFSLYVNELVTSAPAGQVELLAFHGTPDTPTVDVVAAGVGALFSNLACGDFQGYLNIPEGNYTLNITPAGDADTVVARCMANLDGLSDATAVVFASGFLTEALTLDSFGP